MDAVAQIATTTLGFAQVNPPVPKPRLKLALQSGVTHPVHEEVVTINGSVDLELEATGRSGAVTLKVLADVRETGSGQRPPRRIDYSESSRIR